MKKPGFSILELLVVMFFMSILGAIMFETVIKTNSNNAKVEAQALVQRDLNLAIDRFNKVVRSTTMLLEATATNLKIRGYPNVADTAPSEINFYLTGTQAKYSVIPPTGTAPNYTYSSADAKHYLLLGKVTNNAGQPLFYYYDETNAQLALPITLADVRTAAFAPRALDVGNYLTTPITVTTRATMRNFKTNL